MGFISFLGRNSPQPQNDVSSFKAQAYGSTVESLPPILGTNPIPGNGVNAIGSNGIHQLPRKKSKAQLPFSLSNLSLRSGSASPALSGFSAAPGPLVPRLGSSFTLGRPNTAPDDPGAPSDPAFQSSPTPSGKSRSRRDSLRYTVGLLRRTPSHGDFPGTERRRNHNDLDHPPPVPPIPAAHSPAPSGLDKPPRSDAASPSFSTSKTLSDSLNRGPGFVDILDAQGEIRPSNFRSRLQAAGAREYGEDVAERNMAANSVERSSPAVTANYATSSQQPVARREAALPDQLAQRPRTVTYPKRVDSFEKNALPRRKSTREPEPGRKDYGEHFPPHQRSTSTKRRPKPLKLQPILSSSSSESAAEPPEVPRTRTASSPHSRQVNKALPSPRRPRDSVLVAIQSSQRPLNKGLTSPTLQVPLHPHFRDSGFSIKERASKHATTQHGRRRGGLVDLALESNADIDFASAAPAPSIPSFRSTDYPVIHMSNIDKARSKSAHGPRQGLRHRSNSRPSSSSSAITHAYPRTRSLGGLSLPPHPNLSDITEHIPLRTSSRRNWSISSSTPPASASDWSSDLFQRPHSRHTAETSIPPSGSVKSLSLGTHVDMLFFPHCQRDTDMPTYYDIDEHAPRSPAAHAEELMKKLIEGKGKGKGKEPARKNWSPHDTEFGLNRSDSEYSSDGNDSKLQEESLLFREGGYGTGGSGLPGLFDGRSSPTPSDWSVQTMTYDQALDLITPGGLRPPNTPSQKTTFGIPLSTLPSFETSSNDGGSDATSESGIDPKLDAKMAMQVRRELKRRTRIANIKKRHGKQPLYHASSTVSYGANPTSHPQHV
ncbi:hypothetical protein NLU13_5850 [Sarocladium strictum]|uniref:Uncharacterized protein n=1 Tax=Sarocladium strictum TaxID=5046 RepID=A0AA39L6J8_SARSR|nr:hypothetical protein NLU13_5850 [Sarocladium strictum]